jgi:hypothetical protein
MGKEHAGCGQHFQFHLTKKWRIIKKISILQNVEDAIVEMAQRHPLTIIDIPNVIGISEINAKQWVNSLKVMQS